MPEGLAVSASMAGVGYPKAQAFWVGCLTGLIEPIGGALGSAAVWLAEPLLPWTLGFAAGAMLFIVSARRIRADDGAGYRVYLSIRKQESGAQRMKDL